MLSFEAASTALGAFTTLTSRLFVVSIFSLLASKEHLNIRIQALKSTEFRLKFGFSVVRIKWTFRTEEGCASE